MTHSRQNEANASRYNAPLLQPVRVCTGAAGVGSKLIHPKPAKYTSTQECALLARTRYCEVRSLNSPVRKPFTTREGIPTTRSMIAIEDAKYSQCPSLRSKRKLATGSRGTVRGSCSVYPKCVRRYRSTAVVLS